MTILEHNLALAPQVEPWHTLIPSNSTPRHIAQKNSCTNTAGDMYKDVPKTKTWEQSTITEENKWMVDSQNGVLHSNQTSEP